MKKVLLGVLVALGLLGGAEVASAQTTTPFPVNPGINAWTDLGAGPIEVRVIQGGVSLYANASNCTGTPGVQMPLRASTTPADVPFYTTYHVCAKALITDSVLIWFPIGAH